MPNAELPRWLHWLTKVPPLSESDEIEIEPLLVWKTPLEVRREAGLCDNCQRPAEKTGSEGERLCRHHAAGLPDPYRHASPRTGRNDRCHCGSGRKFKNCHMRTGP